MLRKVGPILVILLFTFSGLCKLSREERRDEEAYFGLADVSGVITMLNHPTLGRTPDVGRLVVFQRTDCRTCVMGERTDIHGHYGIGLPKGKYKVILRWGEREGESRDWLAPGQARFVEVTGPGKDVVFNIEEWVPAD